MQQQPMHFEDFKIGDKFVSPQRTITETDIVNFVALAGITEPIFTVREHWEKESLFKKRIAPGPLTFAVSQGLEQQLGLRRGTGMAFLGIDELRATNPVAVGDTLHVEVEVVHKRETRHPDRGIITFKRTVKNQDGAPVMHWLQTSMVRRKPG